MESENKRKILWTYVKYENFFFWLLKLPTDYRSFVASSPFTTQRKSFSYKMDYPNEKEVELSIVAA